MVVDEKAPVNTVSRMFNVPRTTLRTALKKLDCPDAGPVASGKKTVYEVDERNVFIKSPSTVLEPALSDVSIPGKPLMAKSKP